MAGDSGSTQPREPGERRRARLERAPGDRFAPARPAVDDAGLTVSRGSAYAVLAALAGAAIAVLLEALFSLSVGLLAVAAATGWLAAQGLRSAGGAPGRPRRQAVALAAAAAGVALAQVGIWLHARWEGGSLGLFDYLGQTFGWLVPLQLAIAAFVAWWTAR